MKTKNFRFYILMMVIPIIMLSCGGRQKRTGEGGADTTQMGADTTMGARDTAMRGGLMEEEGDFVMDAASGGLMEVELGRVAEKKATNPRVKKFASMMVKDHGKANDELKSIASKKNIQFPTAMEDKHQRKVTDLQEKQGTDFDKEYMDLMVDDHEKDVDRFKREAEKHEDPEIRSFASKTLPTLLMHLDSAKAINESLNR